MFRRRSFSIRYKIAIGYILMIGCLGAAIGIISERIQHQQQEMETLSSKSIEISSLITTIRYNVISMETSQRGYIITGDEAYLEPYTQGKAEWRNNLEDLQDHFYADPEKQKELEGIKATIEHWIDTYGEPTIQLRRDNETATVIDYFRNDSGKSSIERLREQLESLRTDHLTANEAALKLLEQRNTSLVRTTIIILIAVALLSLLIVAYVSHTIVNAMGQVTTAIREIAESRVGLARRIKVRSRDEIQELAEATNGLLESMEMKSWVQKHVADVATMNQGMHNLSELADAFLSHVASMIGAGYGVFYYRRGSGDNDRLDKLASYAAQGEQHGKSSFLIGEGLVGQCAKDKRPFLLNRPDHYEGRIQSSLTEMEPQSVLIIPIELEGKVIAVVEFASMEAFKAQHLKLLEAIEEHFGVAIDNVAGRMEVERLLGESQALTEELQAQSEELQMQQEEMRMTTEHLEEQNLYAEQKTKELEQAKQELEDYANRLEESAQYKSNFLANMSHELRTPLNSILILSQMLYENERSTLSEEESGYARVIHSSGNDLLTLINDILDLSKIEAGKIELVMDEVNLSEIPDILKPGFAPVAENKGVIFRTELKEGLPPTIRTDGQRLQQILKNLLSNAFKFTHKGSVTLTIHSPDSTFIRKHLPSLRLENAVAVSIKDTGIGIPLEKQEEIFEAFQQVDGNTNRIYGGTGLGLSICREFAAMLGGSIVVSSKPGQGSTFTLLLPIERENAVLEAAAAYEPEALEREDEEAQASPFTEEPASTVVPEEEDTVFQNKKVLLVEDDERNIFSICQSLRKKGLHVTVARNGQECLDMVDSDSEARFDLVLMDIMMPVLDGFQTTRALKEREAFRHTPIIALTAKAMKSDRDNCLAAGASDYISKPIVMEQLFSLMRVWLTT
ncbi:ATP-binding protein [Paenibacillus sp. J5C_2022]|uniref:ATP-binding protein n=1 Tax=Paenibacillus sp. J5C2022 TaxID=2977129 RepID=UPI0021CE0EB6|nr:ATP-binding protein [Paenibacillus sp. J5C2022]MCU6710812.1 ATP-binding protein [Paenibacillus sp. J5C2022]